MVMQMALMKNTTQQEVPAAAAAEVQAEAAEIFGDEPQVEAATPAPVASLPATQPQGSLSGKVLDELAEQGFEGLAFDWTSFPIISLKTDGMFEDFDGNNYGKEIFCRVRSSKEQFVFRGTPVTDNKKHLAYSYDKVMTTNGVRVEDKIKEWEAEGKIVDMKTYLQLLVELVDEGGPDDGEYRILSISPTSRGRCSGHIARASTVGGGDPGSVISRIYVGPKVTKVQNPYYPWAFEIVK